MAKAPKFVLTPEIARRQNEVKRQLRLKLESAGNNNQPLSSDLNDDQRRAIRLAGVSQVFKNHVVASQVLAKPKVISRILNGLKDAVSLDAVIQMIEARKIAGERVDTSEILGGFEDEALDRGIFQTSLEFTKFLEGKAAARIANDYNEGELNDEQVLARMSHYVASQIKKDSMAFDFV